MQYNFTNIDFYYLIVLKILIPILFYTELKDFDLLLFETVVLLLYFST